MSGAYHPSHFKSKTPDPFAPQYPAYNDFTIEMRMYAGTSFDAPQTIKATVRNNSGSIITTIALPTDTGFYAHSGSPIWIAISLQDGNTLSLAARVGAGVTPFADAVTEDFEAISPNICTFAGWNSSTWTPDDVTPLLIFSLIADDQGRSTLDLVDLLNSPSLITGNFA